MNSAPLFNPFTWLAMVFSMGCLSLQPAMAAPLALSDTPLFLSTSVEANLFFVLDDSQSMGAETMTSDFVTDRGGVFRVSGTGYTHVYSDGVATGCGTASPCPTVPVNSSSTVPTPDYGARTFAYNRMYYNPARIYDPWPGYAASACTPTNAPVSPVTTSNPTPDRVDLTRPWPALGTAAPMTTTTPAAHYFDWTDAGTLDGFPQNSELTLRATLTAAQQQNFANWFCYHRNRTLAAKFVLAKTITDVPLGSPLRIGLDTLESTTTTKNFPMISITSAAVGDAGYNTRVTKREFIYNLTFDSATPMRIAYQRAGNYFTCNDNTATPFGSGSGKACAIQPTAQGGQCQQNFAVIITDGAYNDDGGYGGTYSPDTVGTLTARGDADDNTNSTSNTSIYDGGPTGPYYSAQTNTLADLAMFYYKTDLSTLPNEVPTICDVDENPQQHLVTYALSFGPPDTVNEPLAHPNTSTSCTATPTVPPPVGGWKDTSSTTEYKINDLVHATYNGRGKFYAATSPELLLDGLQDTINNISGRRGASSAVGLSGTSNITGTQVYVARFYSGTWSGELSAYNISDLINPVWNAHTQLNALTDVTSTGRAIVTYNPTSGAGIHFDWASLTTTQQSDLIQTDTIPYPVAQNRLNYLRGDHSCESGNTASTCSITKSFRPRKDSQGNYTRLGDMVNSAPVYVGVPVSNFPATSSLTATTYQNFRDGIDASAFCTGCIVAPATANNAKTRTPMVYVGGNDGMLHGFRADTGAEVFSYIPNALFQSAQNGTDGLYKLTQNGAHDSYVDLTPAIADAYTATPSDSIEKWRTILVGGLRHGAKGIYALDVTDPNYLITASGTARETNAAAKVMWEFTATDDADLGYTYSQPTIVALKTGATTIDWFAVFGNGYNSTNGRAVLYFVKLSGPKGAGNTWQLGTDYYKIATTPVDSTNPNGLSTPAIVDINSDGVYDYVYAGDIKGNMWKYDLTSGGPSWAIPTNPLFTTAMNPATVGPPAIPAHNQPITVKPTIIRNTAAPSGTPAPNLLVLFGTGQYLAQNDQLDMGQQSFYGVWDKGTYSLVPTNLVQQSITDRTVTDINGVTVDIRTLSNASVTYSLTPTPPITYSGWRMDLPANTGERIVSKATLLGGTLIFPTITPTSGSCGGGGTSWLMAVSPINGNAPGIPVFDTNNNGVIDTDDNFTSYIAAGIKGPMVADYSFLSVPPTTGSPPSNPPPVVCPQGSQVQRIGNSTTANTLTGNMCVEPLGGGRAGRYSWRQLGFGP